ncbi:GOLPH3/VPS74 family protein [Saccharicrinis aurantiacus]|uniref:GOLPH3/VPS74 family protein n=1 Tax=Saccharicrinis aurantiacus TaxID=1849719 RepID=UPI0024903C16|nr:GPP34 family phosphoprotein [Saccharicrinis aurantiacus]
MIENTAERFLILIQHPEKCRFIVSEQIKNVGFLGAIFLDLSNSKNLDIESGRIIVKSVDVDLSTSHLIVIEQIAKSRRIRKIKSWLNIFSIKSRKYQKDIFLGLEKKGIIRINHKRFLGIKYYNTQLTNPTVRDNVISELRNIIFNEAVMNAENSIILGLIEACKMYKIICRDKKEIKVCKRKLGEILKSDLIAQGVDKVIKEMQAAIIGAVVASAVASTTSSN